MNYDKKYEKYKQKYMQAKYNMHGGVVTLTVNDAIGIVELYNKFINAYLIYRARFDNTMPLKDFTALSNIVHKISTQKQVKDEYDKFFVNSLDDIRQLMESYDPGDSDRKAKILFSLRQQTTKLIRLLVLINNESIEQVRQYTEFLKPLKDNDSNTIHSIFL